MLLEREHVVLVGRTGPGKTTLMATLAGDRKPAAGHVRLGHNAKVGYLRSTRRPLRATADRARRTPAKPGSPDRRSGTARRLFSGEDANKQLSDIRAVSSGGSRWRSWSPGANLPAA